MSAETPNGLYLPYRRANISLDDESTFNVINLQHAKSILTYSNNLIAGKDEGTSDTNGAGANRSIGVYDARNGLMNYRAGYILEDPEGYDMVINGADIFEYTVTPDNSIITELTCLREDPSSDRWLGEARLFELKHNGDMIFHDSLKLLTPDPLPTEKAPRYEMKRITEQVAMIMGRDYTVRLQGE
jgi:hypothetical protein